MIDLHTHILPALCDGSQDLETSLEMARIAVADGTTHLACTPHIYPPLYQNHKAGITAARDALQTELDKQNIPLHLIIGADVHMMPEVIQGLKRGTIPTLNGSRYFLLEPSHHVPVLDFLGRIENFLNAGYVPVITHPERLHWFGDKYAEFTEAARMGAWLQITAGAITGTFGQVAKQHAERLLREDYVHIIASDAHGIQQRPPMLSAGVQAAATLLGDSEEAMRMVTERPQAILDNLPPDSITPPAALRQMANNNLSAEALTHINKQGKKNWLGRLFG